MINVFLNLIKQLLHLVSQSFPCSQIPTKYYGLYMKYTSLPVTQHIPESFGTWQVFSVLQLSGYLLFQFNFCSENFWQFYFELIWKRFSPVFRKNNFVRQYFHSCHVDSMQNINTDLRQNEGKMMLKRKIQKGIYT